MPKDANCVFNGEEFQVFTWKQRLPNGQEVLREKLEAKDATTIIPALPNGKVLILNEHHLGRDSYLSFPGGRIESCESPTEGATRELLEETGYTSNNVFLWNKYSPYQRIDRHIDILIAKNCYKIAEQKLELGEKLDLIIIDFDDLLDFVNNEKFRNRILLIEFLRMEVDKRKKNAFKKLLFD